MRSTLFAALLIVAFHEGNSHPQERHVCREDLVDDCGANLMVFTKEPRIPESKPELDEQCSIQTNSIACVKNYTSCLQGFQKMVFSVFIEGVEKMVKPICNSQLSEQKEFLKYAPCLNKAGQRLQKCYHDAVRVLDTVTNADKWRRIPYLCCTFGTYLDCSKTAVAETCDKYHGDYIHNIIMFYAGGILDAVCNDYQPGSSACNSMPLLRIPRRLKFTSILPPMTKILETLL